MASKPINKYNWPGWKLKNSSFGKEFNLSARKRMINGSKHLLPLLISHKNSFKKNILEIGPFFDPLITSKKFKAKNLFYLDNDPYVVKYWKLRQSKNLKVLNYDLNSKTKLNMKFDCIVVSQVFNYIRYKTFLKKSMSLLNANGYLFINNVPNHGISQFFSKERPKTNSEVIREIKSVGFRILQKKIIPMKKNGRLIIVATKNENRN